MKILILTKRQTTGNDVIDNQFGRSWEFPNELAKLSNQVHVFCLSYKMKKEGSIVSSGKFQNQNLSWNSINAGRIKPLGFLRYFIKTYGLAKTQNPDVIISMSDSIYAIIGFLIAKKLNKKCVIDLQDNYRTYHSFKLPLIPWLFKIALKKANLVVCVSEALKNNIDSNFSKAVNTYVIENGISPKKFHPIKKNLCRKEFNLPLDAKIIGVGGSLLEQNGINILFEGFEKMQFKYDNLHLAVVGSRDIEIPKNERIHDLGFVSHERMKYFFNALDVAIVCNTNQEFYQYAFPMKAFETIACEVPMVISKIGPLMKFYNSYPECFFCANKVDSFCKAIKYQLKNSQIFDVKINTWKHLSEDVNACLKNIYEPELSEK